MRQASGSRVLGESSGSGPPGEFLEFLGSGPQNLQNLWPPESPQNLQKLLIQPFLRHAIGVSTGVLSV